VIEELGIEVPSYSKYLDKKLYPSQGLRPRIFFDKETFGVDKLVINPNSHAAAESENPAGSSPELMKQFLADAPLADQAKRDLQRLYQEPKDYFPGLTSTEKKAKLARMSYATYLKDVCGAHEDIIKMYQAMPHPLFGVGFDAVAAQDGGDSTCPVSPG